MNGLPGLVKQEPLQTERRLASGPIALFGDLHATAEDLVTQFLAVLRGAEALKLNVYLVQLIAGLGLAE